MVLQRRYSSVVAKGMARNHYINYKWNHLELLEWDTRSHSLPPKPSNSSRLAMANPVAAKANFTEVGNGSSNLHRAGRKPNSKESKPDSRPGFSCHFLLLFTPFQRFFLDFLNSIDTTLPHLIFGSHLHSEIIRVASLLFLFYSSLLSLSSICFDMVNAPLSLHHNTCITTLPFTIPPSCSYQL